MEFDTPSRELFSFDDEELEAVARDDEGLSEPELVLSEGS